MRNAFFLNITEEEKQSIQDRHRSQYDGYVSRGFNTPKEQILNVENLALDGETCECGKGYTMEELEESIKLKSKAPLVQENISESLNWFKRIL